MRRQRGDESRGNGEEKIKRRESVEGQGEVKEGIWRRKRRGRKVKTEFSQRCVSDYQQTGLTRLGSYSSRLKEA